MSLGIVPLEAHRIEQEIKKSRFIALLNPVANRESARQWLLNLRAEFPDASHICYAYIAGAPSSADVAMSDDGEPNGTAGMPMLRVLEHKSIGHCAVAVVRYFGGTKLGKGGLQRAYSGATNAVITAARFAPYVRKEQCVIKAALANENAIRHTLNQHGASIESIEREAMLVIQFAVAETQRSAVEDALKMNGAYVQNIATA